MSETNETWERVGMPDECPECGEDEDLAAKVTKEDEDGPLEAEIGCHGKLDSGVFCNHTWTWTRSDDDGGN